MTRILTIFKNLRQRNGKALMPFITAGYPSLEATEQVIPCLEQAGASIVEIGFPYSDPIADGPVIAASMHEAIQRGATPPKVFDAIRRVRPRTAMGLIAMVSDSIITRLGPEAFLQQARDSGFDGLIVPDIDLDAARPLAGLTKLHGMCFSLLIAPTTKSDRMQRIVELATGFIYLLARVGITGESQGLDVDGLHQRIAQIRNLTDLPIAVGFGISTPQQVAQVTAHADAAIIGSALVRRMENPATAVASATDFVRELAVGLNR